LKAVKKLALLALPVVMLVLPAVASACPAAKRTSSCCGSGGFADYGSTFGIGLLVGVGSVAVESALRRRRRNKS
jgi:hypothetical protein